MGWHFGVGRKGQGVDVCCEKMRELVARRSASGISAVLPARALPEADARHTVEAAPCLVFRSVARGDVESLRAVARAGQFGGVWGEQRAFINFCPYCGHDWRVPSVAAALAFLTKAEHPAV